MKKEDQLQLFPGMAPEPVKEGVGPPDFSEELIELGRSLPEDVYLGGSTWSFPGWRDLVYDGKYTDVDFYGTVNFTNNVGATLGYRSVDVFYKNRFDNGALKFSGIYISGVVRF